MATTTPPNPSAPFTRYHHPDPVIDRIVQDIYDKLNQIWAKVHGK